MADCGRCSKAVFLEQHLIVAKVGAVGKEAERYVKGLVLLYERLHVHEIKNIYVVQHRPVVYKEDLFSLIALVEQDVVVVQGHGLQSWNQVYQEFLGLVLEELDAVDDLAVGRLNHVSPEGWRQVLEEGLPVTV